jgi:disulfide bond formation protein DsbB
MIQGSNGGIKGWGLSAVALVAVVLGACGGGGSAATPDQIATGQELFRSSCASCHGRNAEGMPKLGKNLHGNEFVAGLDDEELFQFFKAGRPANHPLNERRVDMPPKGGNPALTDDDLRLIAAYVRSIQ